MHSAGEDLSTHNEVYCLTEFTCTHTYHRSMQPFVHTYRTNIIAGIARTRTMFLFTTRCTVIIGRIFHTIHHTSIVIGLAQYITFVSIHYDYNCTIYITYYINYHTQSITTQVECKDYKYDDISAQMRREHDALTSAWRNDATPGILEFVASAGLLHEEQRWFLQAEVIRMHAYRERPSTCREKRK